MLLKSLVETIELLKTRLDEHGADLRASETRTRMALINPMLAALGWNPADPSLVMPEYVLDTTKERADYALIRPDGKPAAILEAKRLGESLETHRMQMLNYANSDGVDYAGITDGNFWQFYSVFERRSIIDRRIINISISNDMVHEIALHMLALWHPNLESDKAASVSKPILLRSNLIPEPISTPKAADDGKNFTSRVSIDWLPMDQVIPIPKQTPPEAMKLPNGHEVAIKYWGEILIQTAIWLSNNGHLTRGNVPIPSSKKRYIVNSQPIHPNGNSFIGEFKVPNASVFVEKNVSASRAIDHAKKLLVHCNQSAKHFLLKIG